MQKVKEYAHALAVLAVLAYVASVAISGSGVNQSACDWLGSCAPATDTYATDADAPE